MLARMPIIFAHNLHFRARFYLCKPHPLHHGNTAPSQVEKKMPPKSSKTPRKKDKEADKQVSVEEVNARLLLRCGSVI